VASDESAGAVASEETIGAPVGNAFGRLVLGGPKSTVGACEMVLSDSVVTGMICMGSTLLPQYSGPVPQKPNWEQQRDAGHGHAPSCSVGAA